jgi:hypothetical protein
VLRVALLPNRYLNGLTISGLCFIVRCINRKDWGKVMIRKCNRCDTPVVYVGVSTGYSCVCPEHDEDLYLIETYLG